jgi:hypothetical protein
VVAVRNRSNRAPERNRQIRPAKGDRAAFTSRISHANKDAVIAWSQVARTASFSMINRQAHASPQ